MITTVTSHLRLPRGEQVEFLRGLIANPRGVSSVFPSGRTLAHLIAAQVDVAIPGAILELGPGTGAVTRALLQREIAPARLLLIEQDRAFVDYLRTIFPAVVVQQDDALNSKISFKTPLAAVVSGLPLLHFPMNVRTDLVACYLDRLSPGAPFVQVSFGMHPPVPARRRWVVRRAGVVLRNIPPATVWVYEKLIDCC